MLVSLISISVITALRGEKEDCSLSSEGNLSIFSVSSSPDSFCIASAFVISTYFFPFSFPHVFLSDAVRPLPPAPH